LPTYRLEYETLYTHKDGGVLGTRHLIVLEAETPHDALAEANRRFGQCGSVNASGFKRLRSKPASHKETSKLIRIKPAFL
jgi:hypothetical protein